MRILLPALFLALLIPSIGPESAIADEATGVPSGAYWCVVADAASKHAYQSSVQSVGSHGGGRRSQQIEKFMRAASGLSGTAFAVSADTCHWFRSKRDAETSLDTILESYAERGFTVEVVAVY